jgi:hypothetical protein
VSTIRLAYHPEGGATLIAMQKNQNQGRPDVRLAFNPGPVNAYGALSNKPDLRLAIPMSGRPGREGKMGLEQPPAVRLAVAPHSESGGANSVEHHVTSGGLGRPSVRLAFGNSPAERNGTSGLENPSVRLVAPNIATDQQGVPALMNNTSAPALLVSYYYLEPFLKNQSRYRYRDWVMDSGAFSAHNSGVSIDILAYIEKCKELLTSDPTLTEVYSLDVIGDWRASLRNTERMWEAGIQAIPCYHINEPEDVLKEMAKIYPKIALGGVAMAKGGIKMKFASQCFARVWPKKIHGFGYGTESHIMSLPWHSVDATNWELGPCKFGRWAAYGNMSVRGSNQNLRSEVEHYLEIERRARVRWRKQMQELEGVDGVLPTVRLAAQQANDSQIKRSGLEKPDVRLAADFASGGGEAHRSNAPTVRLAHKNSGREKGKF